MICEICTDQENGSTNFETLTLPEHGSTDSHKCATEAKEKGQTTIASKPIPVCKITFEVPAKIILAWLPDRSSEKLTSRHGHGQLLLVDGLHVTAS